MARRERTDDPEALAEAMLDTYRAHNDRHHDTLIRSFDGVVEMLDALSSVGIRLGVVTSKREGTARRGLQRYGLERFFEVAVFHDDTARHKPHPEPLLLAASRLGVSRQRAVYVGDSVHDIAAGAAAGMRTIAALWGPFPRTDLEAAGPDHIPQAPRHVVQLLGADL
jgi:pyrophosphatase PpaX